MRLELTPNGVQLHMGSIVGTVFVPQYIKVGNTALQHHILMFGPQQAQEIIDWFRNGADIIERYQEAVADGMQALPPAPVPPPPPPPVSAQNAEQAAAGIVKGKQIVEAALGITPPPSSEIPIDKPNTDTLPSPSGLTDEAVAAYIASHSDPEALIRMAATHAPESAAEFIGPIQQDAAGNPIPTDAQGNRVLGPPP